jgi:hypothetical protein
MYPHRIRLRGPWNCEPLVRATGTQDLPLPAPFRAVLPSRWHDIGLAGFTGRVRFRRRFGYPGRIDDFERVWLTFAAATGSVAICLNDQMLGHFEWLADTAEFEVTDLLRARNELVVDEESRDDYGGLWEVALEVRCAAYLRDVCVLPQRDGNDLRLIVTGLVVGVCPNTLEVYVVAQRSTVAYSTIEATPDGQPFQLLTDPVNDREGECLVRVDLVNGASVWFRYETEISWSPS